MIRFLSFLLLVGCAHPLSERIGAVSNLRGTTTKRPPILFIHGMFMNPLCWQNWQQRFEVKGYKTSAPAWPLHDGAPAELRTHHPDPQIAKLTLEQLVDYYAAIINEMPDKPILIGHSMGGLIVQLLLQRNLGVPGGIAIDSAPPKGIFSLKYSFLKSNLPVVGPGANKDEPYLMPVEQFHYVFTNTLNDEENKQVYDRFVVPESRRVGAGATTDTAKIDFAAAHSPLLIIAGGDDHILPASLNWENYRAYKKSPSITEFREFSGRTHYTLGQSGWEAVADFVGDWIALNIQQ